MITQYYVYSETDVSKKKAKEKADVKSKPEAEVASTSKEKFYRVSNSLQDAFAAGSARKVDEEVTSPKSRKDEQTFSFRSVFGDDAREEIRSGSNCNYYSNLLIVLKRYMHVTST